MLACIICSALILGCNPQKKIIREPLKDKGADYLFEQLKKNEFHFDWLSIKFSAEVTFNKNSNSFSGNARIRKDSAIWMAIYPALGIEALRILVTTDSVKMLNRIAQTYFCGDFKYMNKLLQTDLDFDMLQSLLIGNDFSTYENDVFKASVDGLQYKLSTIGRRRLKKHLKSTEDSLIIVQDIWLDPDSYKIEKVHMKELKQTRKLEAKYSDFAKVDSMFFPYKLHFDIESEKDKMEISIDNSKVTAAGPLTFPFNVSDKYDRIKY